MVMLVYVFFSSKILPPVIIVFVSLFVHSVQFFPILFLTPPLSLMFSLFYTLNMQVAGHGSGIQSWCVCSGRLLGMVVVKVLPGIYLFIQNKKYHSKYKNIAKL